MRYWKNFVLVLALVLVPVFLGAPACNPVAPVITIVAPEEGSVIGSCPAAFEATLENVTEELFLTLSVTIDDVAISSDGTVDLGEQSVTISNFSATSEGVSFTACNLPAGDHVFTVSVGTSEEDLTEGTANFGVEIRNRACKDLLANEGMTFDDGNYLIDPDGPDGEIAPFEAFCDMTTDGGGWTQITLAIARLTLGAEMVAVDSASTAGIDDNHRPYTRDTSDNHTYHYTIPFPAGFDAFYLSGYKAKANAAGGGNTSDIYPDTFQQTLWSKAYLEGGVGDISFGAAEAEGPVASFARELTSRFDNASAELPWPADGEIFEVTGTSSAFRIGWGEAGPQYEGWYPWWAGTIFVR